MPFRFQTSVTYEQLRLFVKDIFSFTGSLPNYEANGLIMQIRNLAISLLSDYAEAFAKNPQENSTLILEKCIASTAKIAALIDLCGQLSYTDNSTRNRWLLNCEDLSRRLHEAKKPQK